MDLNHTTITNFDAMLSGAIIGSESFVSKIVQTEEEAFPTGHKTPPVDFGIGGVVLKTLRNLSILR